MAAESRARRLDNRLGNLLLRAGYVTQEQLDQVLKIQKETQQRMGFLLVRERLVEPEELREALRLQISRIVYSAFRWPDGRFHFTQEGTVDYDADHMAPVSTDTVLMEAAQIVDEWPILERKVGALTEVFRRAPGVETLNVVTGQKNAPEGTLSVSRPEAETWRWIDGRRSVGDIMERAFLSDFEVLKGTVDLLGRNLIERAGRRKKSSRRRPSRWLRVVAAARLGPRRSVSGSALAALAALSLYLIPKNPANVLLRPPGEMRETADLLKSISLNRAVSIERAVRDLLRLERAIPAQPRGSRRRRHPRRGRPARSVRPLLPLHPAGRGREVRPVRPKRRGPDRPRPVPRAEPRAGLGAAPGAVARPGPDGAAERPGGRVAKDMSLLDLTSTKK